MNLLQSHIEQISQSSNAIAGLPFSSPRPFTHALLRTTDITSLIRDTEAHERALFTLSNPQQPPSGNANTTSSSSRAQNRKSIYDVAGLSSTGQGYGSSAMRARSGGPKANSAVARILGGDLLERIRRAEGGTVKGELDVSALLDGAEKLCEVYPIAGAQARIMLLRQQYVTLATSIERYEHIVEGQMRELEKLNRGREGGMLGGAGDEGKETSQAIFTRDDLRREEKEIKELEERRKLLEQRVHGMERDLGGLMK